MANRLLTKCDDDVYVEENKPPSPQFITRSALPAKRVPKSQQSVWNIIKNAIGKDFSRLTTPIIFNEPLSFIQRLAEYTENIHLLYQAAASTDPCERIELLGSFAVSTLSSQRLSKPFNPLLLETYEFEKPEIGFRFIAEQVSHHPPISAFHVSDINGGFEMYGSVAPRLRFWGRSLECDPQANFTIKFYRWNEIYTWNAVTFNIHNIIMGKMYMALNGTMVVQCHSEPREFRLNFKGASRKNGPELLVQGEVLIDKKRVRSIYGNFCRYLASCPPNVFDDHFLEFEKAFQKHADSDNEESRLVLLRESKLLWQRFEIPNSSEDYYDFSYHTLQLNELSPSMTLPRTDSRLRPDVRFMENGEFDKASDQKKYLEDKQRAVAKLNLHRQPKWFKLIEKDEFGREQQWHFSGEYWSRQFDDCAEIY